MLKKNISYYTGKFKLLSIKTAIIIIGWCYALYINSFWQHEIECSSFDAHFSKTWLAIPNIGLAYVVTKQQKS